MLQQQQQHKINDILKGKETKGAAHQYEKAGDFDSAFTWLIQKIQAVSSVQISCVTTRVFTLAGYHNC